MSDIVERLRDTADAFELAHAPHHLVFHMRAGADEIERLRAGGCARNQRTTQYCAEAAKMADEITRLRVVNERLRTALEKLATGYHGGVLAQQIARAALGGDNGLR